MSLGNLPWLLLGCVSVALGALGLVLPLLPTTPFLLLGAYGFARSSPRLHAWLIDHPQLGGYIRDWQTHRAIDRRAKRLSVGAMAGALALSIALGLSPALLAVQGVVLLAAAAFVLSRPSPPR